MSTIITRAGKGSPLTNNEVDANFNNLNSTKLEVFGSQTANTVYASPNGSAGVPTFRAIVASDVPTLNQNTTGTAANVTGIVAIANGGTGASTDATARTALGLGTIATQAANSVAITGGTVNGTTVGATTVAAGSFSTLNSSGATRLGGLSGNQSLQVNNVASAVNYLQAAGAATGGYPIFSAQGADANVGFVFNAKGTAAVAFQTNFVLQAQVSYTASSVNYLNLTGAITGAAPTLSAFSYTDTNTSLNLKTQAAGSVNFVTGGGTQAVVSNTASAVNYAQVTGAATGGAPTVSAQGSDANIGLKITPKGTLGVVIGATNPSTATLQVDAASGNSEVRMSIGGATRGQIISSSALQYFVNGGSGNQLFYLSGATQFAVSPTASAVNYVQATGAVTTGAPELSAQGSDTNINLKLTPKGTGVLQFGTYTAGIIAQTGYITITDAGGTSRRLLVG